MIRRVSLRKETTFKNWISILPREILAKHVFPFLSLLELGNLDKASISREARSRLLEALHITELNRNIIINSVNCANWVLSRGIRLFDITIENRHGTICSLLFRYSPNIRRLVFSNEPYGDTIVRLIATTLKKITQIEIINWNKESKDYLYDIDDDSIVALSRECPCLVYLDLAHCKHISVEAINSLALGCPNINHLNLPGFNLDVNELVARLSTGFTNLTHLDISGGHELSDDSILLMAGGCPNIIHLDLKNCYLITTYSMLFIAQNCSKLIHLNLSQCDGITDDAMSTISQYCPQLTYLDLSGCDDLSDNAIIALFQGCINLAHLNLGECDFSDASIIAITFSPRAHCLLNLTLCDCNITDVSVILLSQGCPNLVSLDVSRCETITDDSVFMLPKGCPKLERILLKGCYQLTFASITVLLEECSKLRYLDICQILSTFKNSWANEFFNKYPSVAIILVNN